MSRGPLHVVAVLGRVADAEAHEVEAAAVHQVDDELELVHRLEVRELGLVAGLDERLERHLDQGRRAAAQDRLLAEEVGLGLLLERRLEDAGAGVAERPGVGQDPARGRCPTASCSTANRAGTPPPAWYTERTRWPGPLGATIPTSTFAGRVDPPEAQVEAVGEHQQLAGAQVRPDLGVVDGLLGRVRARAIMIDVGGPHGVRDVGDPQPGLLGDGPGSWTRAPARRRRRPRSRAGSAHGHGPGAHTR